MEVFFINVTLQGKKNVCPDFRTFLASAGSHWPLAQNNPYAKEAYFEVASSGPLHWYPNFTSPGVPEEIVKKMND